MNKAPIDRDLQIQLIENVKERQDALMKKWASNKTVRSAISKPVEEQVDEPTYSQNDSVLSRYA